MDGSVCPWRIIISLFAFSSFVFANEEIKNKDVMSARVRLHWMTFKLTARGQEVHKQGSPSVSHNAKFVAEPGLSPMLEFLNSDGEAVEVVGLHDYNQEECNQRLLDYGFYKKSHENEKVPEEHLTGPYVKKESISTGTERSEKENEEL